MQLSIFISPATAEFLPFLRELVGLNGLGPSEVRYALRFRFARPRSLFPFLVPRHLSPSLAGIGGLKWTRTIDLTLIRRVL